ncbi:MAG TPA: carbon-nitrogen hydrolase family protein [Acidimicrobiales bacterium]|nr:carbon-nitrogen hydrolase family protein [Acidimicrobiales bacterium]
MRAAVVQLSATQDKETNLELAVRTVEQAASAGAELVVLPEATMCGFGSPSTDLAASAEPLDGPFVTTLATVASATGATVVAGMFEPASDSQRVYNTVVAVSPDGLLGHYRKLHLYDALGWQESRRVAPGHPETDGVLVVPVGEFRLGVMTCYDLRFPEVTRTLCDAGATALAVPAAWVAGPRKAEQWATLLAARAIESTSYVLAAAQPAPDYTGCSTIIDPSGEALVVLDDLSDARCHDLSQALGFADLSEAEVARVREVLPVLDHRRFSVLPRP